MDPKRRFYWLWAAIGLLLCLNLLTVGWVVRRTTREPASRPLPEGQLVRQLGFSRQQLRQYRQHRIQFRQQVRPHEDSLRQLRVALIDRIKAPSVSDDELNRLSEAMYRQNRQITRIRFRHWQQVRSLCLPDQKGRFDEWMQQTNQGGAKLAGRERIRDRLTKKRTDSAQVSP